MEADSRKIPENAAPRLPYRMIIWGCGTDYNRRLQLLQRMEENEEIRIVGLYDRGIRFGTRLDGYPLLQKEEIAGTPHDFVLVMTEAYEKDVIREYRALTGDREKAIPGRILDIPGLTLARYLEIRNAGLSILSETCYGGHLSRLLGIEHRSPFKNLWISHPGYLKIMSDLRGYMALTPEFAFYRRSGNPGDEPRYPVLKLGDVQINCNHDTDAETAIRTWERRKTLINYDRLLLTIYADDDEIRERFHLLEGFARKLCFVPHPTDRPDEIYVPYEGGLRYESQHRSAQAGNNLVDIYSLFFGEIRYRRSGF